MTSLEQTGTNERAEALYALSALRRMYPDRVPDGSIDLFVDAIVDEAYENGPIGRAYALVAHRARQFTHAVDATRAECDKWDVDIAHRAMLAGELDDAAAALGVARTRFAHAVDCYVQ